MWGQQPTIANFGEKQLRKRSDEVEYLLRIARLRKHALKYLRDGVFLRPPKLDVPREQIPISRLSIYAGQQDTVKEYSKTVPLVLASVWRAPDGNLAVALANIGDRKVALNITLNKRSYSLPASGAVYPLTEQGRAEFADFNGGSIDLGITMDPCDARIYEVVGH